MEVVVATTLLALVGFLVVQLFASSRLLHHQSLMRAKALELGTARLELLKSSPFESLTPGSLRLADVSYRQVQFHTVQTIQKLAEPNLVLAECEIEWQDSLGRRQVKYASYIARR
jgi:hypothetical protein